jgi:hypothetical protein
LEKIHIVSSETDVFGNRRHYSTINKDEIQMVSVQINRSISAIGDASEKDYGNRSFISALTYNWIVK